MDFIDCQCFAGGLTYSTVAEGFHLVGKREHDQGFGVQRVEANRHILGNDWETEACDPNEWTAKNVTLVIGNPPCSGFSTLNTSKNRGINSPVNECMRDFVRFAGRCRPPFIVMESVQQAYSKGRELMLQLRDIANEVASCQYTLYHVLHSCAALGGPQLRKRYFMVLSRLPFGVHHEGIAQMTPGIDWIRDLQPSKLQWEPQGYSAEAGNKDAFRLRNEVPHDGFDGHITADRTYFNQINKTASLVPWKEGELLGDALDRLKDNGYTFEDVGMEPHKALRLILYDSLGGMGGHSCVRVKSDRAWPVVDGSSMGKHVHPLEPRLLTYRETSRLMGMPDGWQLKVCKDYPSISHVWFGKGVTTWCGRWITKWVRHALKDEPGDMTGEEIGERERLINITNRFIKPGGQR